MRDNFHAVTASVLLLMLAACGGGGTSTTATASPGTLTGVAATGAAIASAPLAAKCVTGPVLSGTTDANGAFTLTLTSAHTAPCILQVTGGTPSVNLYSFAIAAGQVNVSPLTDLVLAKSLGGDPAVAYTAFDATKGSAISAGLAAAKAYVQTQITSMTGAGTADPLTSSFAVGSADDKVLDALGAALTAAGKSVAELRTGAQTGATWSSVVPAFLSAPAGVSASASSASQISLNWNAVPTATGYNIYRSTTSNVQLVVGNKVNAQAVTTAGGYSVSNLTASTAYYFKVTAVNGIAPESAGSAEITATTSASSTGTSAGAIGTASNGTPTVSVASCSKRIPAGDIVLYTGCSASAVAPFANVTVTDTLSGSGKTCTASYANGMLTATDGTLSGSQPMDGSSNASITNYAANNVDTTIEVMQTSTIVGTTAPKVSVSWTPAGKPFMIQFGSTSIGGSYQLVTCMTSP